MVATGLKPAPTGAIRVLVVDDDEAVCRSTAQLLRWKGHCAQVAFDGHEAIEQLNAFTPDLVLLDVAMPGMDGLQVARAIRKTQGIKEPVIAAVTGHREVVHKRRCAAAGFDHYLQKPVDPLALDQLLWFVDDRADIRENFLTLRRERIAACYELARSQLEFCGMLMDSAAATREADSKERCLTKVERLQSRLATYLANEIGFSGEQLSSLQIWLCGLQVRLTTVLGKKQ